LDCTARDRAVKCGRLFVELDVVSKGISALEGLFAAREGTDKRSVFAVDDDVALDFGLEFEDFAAIGGEAGEGFLAVDQRFGIGIEGITGVIRFRGKRKLLHF